MPVCNRKFTGNAYQYLKTLAAPKEFYDIGKIKDFVFSFNYTQLNSLCKYLIIDPNYLVYNIIGLIINDMMSLEIDVIDSDFEKINLF